MSVKAFHQCGHQSNWNLESYQDEKCGAGLILSPVHQAKSNILKLAQSTRENSFFDPQYYLPSSQKSKLKSYDFFPENISGGFETQNFEQFALKSARLCVLFQMDCQFSRFIIPARYIDQMVTDFIERQNAYTVHPFLTAISELGIDAPVYLTLVLTSAMVCDAGYRTNLLNWVTSFPEISGLYLIHDHPRNTKQVRDQEFLFQYLTLLREVRSVGLDVVAGYLNTEALLLTLVEGVDVTYGSFENTRIFSVDKFLENEEERRGPRARIYLPGLFNWIQVGQAKQIRNAFPRIWERIYEKTEESEAALNAAVEPYFNQPQLYKHHFKVFQRQIDHLSALGVDKRHAELRASIKEAISIYTELEESSFDLEKHGSGAHLQEWLDAINRFNR